MRCSDSVLSVNVKSMLACSRLRDSGEKSFSKKKFARFKTSALYYLGAWHRLSRCRNRVSRGGSRRGARGPGPPLIFKPN